jgi:hypothetical protein
MEYTQEQLDAMIAEAKKGLFSEEELTKRVTAEVDRRVETGIQKGLETQKQKWERELAEKAKMTAEEIAQKDYEEKLSGLTQKEREIKRKANELDAKSKLADANIPKSHYDKFISVLVSDDETATNTNVENFIAMFNETKVDIETRVKSEITKMPAPQQGGSPAGVTKTDFDKMPYSEKLKFKQSNPELYAKFMK